MMHTIILKVGNKQILTSSFRWCWVYGIWHDGTQPRVEDEFGGLK